ncbi:MAG: ABC transporter ATP-binding protein [Chloroflexota bacterium]
MNHTAIQIRGLSKRYTIGAKLNENKLSIKMLNSVKSMFRRDAKAIDEQTHVWALRDIDIDIQEGESVGIIGRNGAGKSTLLKIISQITAPTTGRIEINGSIGALLEVGTGFHPELTGRQNVFLSGAIRGMTRKRMAALFDEIVDFSGVETFIDTPVKHYSSGMYMRLAFAVSIFAETDILIVDEVLAVGDSQFQKKCIAKMQQATAQGRTLLFVSHQLALLGNVCDRCILLAKGQKRAEGPAREMILEYINELELADGHDGQIVWSDPQTAPATPLVRLNSLSVISQGKTSAVVDIDKEFQIEIEFAVLKSGTPFYVRFHIINSEGVIVFNTINGKSANLIPDEWAGRHYPEGIYRSTCTIPGNFMNDGNYSISTFIVTSESNFIELAKPNILSFTVRETGEMRAEFMGVWLGAVRPKLAWRTEQIEGEIGLTYPTP